MIHIHIHTLDDDWKEEEHPRKKTGKFAPRGGGEASGAAAGKDKPASSGQEEYNNALKAYGDYMKEHHPYPDFQNRTEEIIKAYNEKVDNDKTVEELKKNIVEATQKKLQEEREVSKKPAFSEADEKKYDKEYSKLIKQAPKATAQESEALDTYVNEMGSLNKKIRKGTTVDPTITAGLDSYIERSSLKAGKVYRGVTGSFAEKLKKMAPGTVLQDKGYMSTSINPRVAGDFAADPKKSCLLEMEVSDGAKGAAISQFKDREVVEEEEHEVLIKRNSKLVVVGYDQKTNTMRVKLVQDAD